MVFQNSADRLDENRLLTTCCRVLWVHRGRQRHIRLLARSRGTSIGARAMPHAKRHAINPKTVAKWKKRSSVADERTERKELRSTVLSVEEQAMVAAFRRHTLLPLDDCLYALQATIPHLTRSFLHHYLQRHGVGRPPNIEGEKVTKKKSRVHPSAFSISPMLKFRPLKVGSICSWPLIESPSFHLSSCTRKPRVGWRATSCANWQLPCPTRSILC